MNLGNFENSFNDEDEYFEQEPEHLKDFISDMDKNECFYNLIEKSTEQDESDDFIMLKMDDNNKVEKEEYKIPKMDENNKFYMIITSYDESSNVKEVVTVKNEEKSNTFLSENTKTIQEKTILNDNLCSDDNLRKKCKDLMVYSILNFVNKIIKEPNNKRIGRGICLKQLGELIPKEKMESNINYNKEFLIKTIDEIFSGKISGRFSNFMPDDIQKLLNEENIDIRNFFTQIFNLTFFQYLEHFYGTKNVSELIDMKDFDDDIKDFIEEENLLEKFENIINNKNSKKMLIKEK